MGPFVSKKEDEVFCMWPQAPNLVLKHYATAEVRDSEKHSRLPRRSIQFLQYKPLSASLNEIIRI